MIEIRRRMPRNSLTISAVGLLLLLILNECSAQKTAAHLAKYYACDNGDLIACDEVYGKENK